MVSRRASHRFAWSRNNASGNEQKAPSQMARSLARLVALVEAAGVEPASEERSPTGATCFADLYRLRSRGPERQGIARASPCCSRRWPPGEAFDQPPFIDAPVRVGRQTRAERDYTSWLELGSQSHLLVGR